MNYILKLINKFKSLFMKTQSIYCTVTLDEIPTLKLKNGKTILVPNVDSFIADAIDNHKPVYKLQLLDMEIKQVTERAEELIEQRAKL